MELTIASCVRLTRLTPSAFAVFASCSRCCFASENANQNDRNDNDTKQMTIREASIKHHKATIESHQKLVKVPRCIADYRRIEHTQLLSLLAETIFKNALPTLNIQISESTWCGPLEIESFDLSLATHVADPAGPSS